MREEVTAYLEEAVIPLIAREHPEVVSEMSIRVEGSAGLGMNDELSDLEVMVYLPGDIWKDQGGQLQLTLIHSLKRFSPRSTPHCEFPGDPYSWHVYGHPEVNVHPRGELLAGTADAFLAGAADIPWAAVEMEELFALQRYPIVRDAKRALGRMREATAPSRLPKEEWVRRIILALASLKGETWDLEKAVRRGRSLPAEMILGAMLPVLLRLAYLINRRYYPWRTYLVRFLEELPVGRAEWSGDLEALASEQDWRAKLAATQRTVRGLTRMVLDGGLLTAAMLEYIFDARDGQAWRNPNWRDASDRRRMRAQEAGYDWLDGWIWGWWGWQESRPAPAVPPPADRL